MAEVQIVDIVRCVRTWVESVLSGNLMIGTEILLDSQSAYRAIFIMNECMAEVYVAKPDFAPYRSICFQVVALVNNKSDIIYSWFDSNEDAAEIVEQLDKGFLFALNYGSHSGCAWDTRD